METAPEFMPGQYTSMISPSCIFCPWAWGENAALQLKNCYTFAHFPDMATCMWSMAGDILEHPIS